MKDITPLLEGGYIKVYRATTKSAVWSNPKMLKVWLWCLCRANYEPNTVSIESEQIRIERGQFVMGCKAAAVELGMPKSTVSRYVHTLEKWGNVVLKVGRRFTVVTVCNYETYQGNGVGGWDKVGTKLGRSWDEVGNREEGKKERSKEVKKEREDASHPQSLDEVKEYFVTIGGSSAEAEKFWNYYGSNGWRVGRNPMKNWHMAASGWVKRVPEYAKSAAAPQKGGSHYMTDQALDDARKRATEKQIPICKKCGARHYDIFPCEVI